MKKICAYCGVEFEAKKSRFKFCGRDCARMWRKRETFRRNERWAEKFGLPLDEVERMLRTSHVQHFEEAERLGIPIKEAIRRHAAARYAADKAEVEKLGISSVKEYRRLFGTSYQKKAKTAKTANVPPKVRQPKTYAEIRAANRRRPVEAGWRGQVVIGGGVTLRGDSPLSIHELPRMRDVTCGGRKTGEGRAPSRP